MLKKLIDANFLLNDQPASDFNSLIPLIAIFAGLIILGIVSIVIFKNLDSASAKIKKGINSWMISLGILGFIIVFFRWQQSSFLSKNFALELIGFIWFIWLIVIMVYMFFKYPNEKYSIQEKKRIEKYIPKAKKKK